MYAIVRIGGKQYHAEVGNTIVVEKLPYEVGHRMNCEEVLLISDGEKTRIGQPYVEGASVDMEIVEQFKGKKIIVFKYKPKIRYRRKQGHRQNYTRLLVNTISSGEGKAAAGKTKAASEAEISQEVQAIEESKPAAKKTRSTKKTEKSEETVAGGKTEPAAKKTRSTKKKTAKSEETVASEKTEPAAKKARSTKKKTSKSEEA